MGKLVGVKRGLWEQLYLPEVLRGVGITLRHFFVNLFTRKEIITVNYPEERRELPERYRGVHRLMKREDGSVRCTACMMCATVCPANCIHIVAGERENSTSRDVEKYPVRFEIDELVCVVCGLCVEACPCDALRMDTHVHMKPVTSRGDALLGKEALMSRGARSVAVDGGAGGEWRQRYTTIGATQAIYRPDHLKKDER
ncbi:MAG: NADH-quinone oxidoreductase subunit I [Deltaproteobacteria bacterium]|nr:NADH-quinone oxidoreductase subunit I [Deltaproteobacteria bacterium]